METLRSDSAHTSESVHSALSCINANHIDEELSKEKEEELLYGTAEDGDDEDALSDDSMRLRVTDDDESEDVLTPNVDDQQRQLQHVKTDPTPTEADVARASSAPEKELMKNDTIGNEARQEDHRSGNFSMDDKVVNEHRPHMKRNQYGVTVSPVIRPWPRFDPRWNFVCPPRNRSFHSFNRFPYARHRYAAPCERYRFDSYEYNNRFENMRPYFHPRRGIGNSKYPSYHKDYLSDDRKEQKFSSKSLTVPKDTSPNKHTKNLPPSAIVDAPAINVSHVDSNSTREKCTEDDNEIVENGTLGSEKLTTNENGNSNLNDVIGKSKNTAVTDNPAGQINSLEFQNENTTHAMENSEKSQKTQTCTVIKHPIDIDTGRVNDLPNEKLTGSLTNVQDSNMECSGEDETSVRNKLSGTCDSQKSATSTNAETSFIQLTNDKDDEGEDSNCDTKQDETTKVPLDQNIENNGKIAETCQLQHPEDKEQTIPELKQCDDTADNLVSQSVKDNGRIELSEDHSGTVSNDLKEKKVEHGGEVANGVIINDGGEGANSVIINDEKEKEIILKNDGGPIQNPELNVISNISKASDTVSTIVICNQPEKDINIEISQNTVTPDTITHNKECDKHVSNDADDSENCKINKSHAPEDQLSLSKNIVQEEGKGSSKNDVAAVYKENVTATATVNEQSEQTEEMKCTLEKDNLPNATSENENHKNSTARKILSTDENSSVIRHTSLGPVTNSNRNGDRENKNDKAPVTTQKRRRRSKKMIAAQQAATIQEENQVKEGGRQKRKTAKNAEEIIRNKFLNADSDLESSDGSDKFVIVNHRMKQDARSLSPPSLKRTCPDSELVTMNGVIKKVKVNSDVLSNETATKESNSENIKQLAYIQKLFQRDLKNKLPKMKQEELEELLIQKIVETITMRGEIGRLREQARISERNQDATRTRCQLLMKQIKDFEMVLNRNAADRCANNDKLIPPIKINRSVGLQVNFMTEQGVQNLRQIQQNAANMKPLNVSNSNNTPVSEPNNNTSTPSPARRGIKVRSPRRSDTLPAIQTTVVSQNHTQSPSITPNVTPAALVVAKPVLEGQHTLTLPNQPNNVQQILPNLQQQPPAQQQAIVLNEKLPNQLNRQGNAVNIPKSKANDLIDLTDEEEKSKAAINVSAVPTTLNDQLVNLPPKSQQCFQRVIQALPANVAIATQPASIRVVQPSGQPTPTALVNNMNAPRLAYVMQSGVGPTRQLLIAPNSSQMRPVTSCNRTPFSTVTYKTGTSTIANGTVRVLTTPANSNIQLNKHPAPLPDTRNYSVNPTWKLPPPAPSLKISKVANGIVLSWNMNLSYKYADIASYQLYAYQEIAGTPPSTSLWKKVGDVRALPLPMACTLTQFSEGNNYYFAVRAVDTHSRKGQYSVPGNISL